MKLSSMPSKGGPARKEYDPLQDAHLAQHFKNPKVFHHLARAGLLPAAAAAAPGDGSGTADALPAAARRAAASAAASSALAPSLLSSSTLHAADPALQLRALEADAATLAKEEAAIRVRL